MGIGNDKKKNNPRAESSSVIRLGNRQHEEVHRLIILLTAQTDNISDSTAMVLTDTVDSMAVALQKFGGGAEGIDMPRATRLFFLL